MTKEPGEGKKSGLKTTLFGYNRTRVARNPDASSVSDFLRKGRFLLMVQQSLALWIAQYGYPAIFFLLVGGIVGLPIPDQLLLIVSGYLVLTKSLSMGPTLVAAVLGSIVGITLSYALGRASGSYVSRL